MGRKNDNHVPSGHKTNLPDELSTAKRKKELVCITRRLHVADVASAYSIKIERGGEGFESLVVPCTREGGEPIATGLCRGDNELVII